MTRPMHDMLLAAQGRTRLHMPGHKGGLDPFDMTELAVTDDLYQPAHGIAKAERLAAEACGAAHTLMLTGGSTAGLLCMILSAVPPGGRLVLPRNIHHAAISACIWGGIDAVFTDSFDALPDGDAVLVTRPDYYGRCIDLAHIVQAAHTKGMLVLVDEAHGAHFPWADAPQSAAVLGADAWVQSAHKTLPALTGAAWLHMSAGMDASRARRFLRMVQTSSPPFPILRSLDEARARMAAHGREALSRLGGLLKDFRASLPNGYEDIHTDDPTRLVIGTRGRGYTGLAAQDALAARGVDVEMADLSQIVCICTVCDTAQTFENLRAALDALPQCAPLPPAEALPLPPTGGRALSLRDAALGPQEMVPLTRAAGRIAAASAGLYPPGIPLVLPGEIITGECAQLLASLPADRRFGAAEDAILCTK